jgi:hypothetical protein
MAASKETTTRSTCFEELCNVNYDAALALHSPHMTATALTAFATAFAARYL